MPKVDHLGPHFARHPIFPSSQILARLEFALCESLS